VRATVKKTRQWDKRVALIYPDIAPLETLTLAKSYLQ